MIIASVIIGAMMYVIGVAYVAVETLPLAEESGAGRGLAVLAGCTWPVLLTVGIAWSVAVHLSDFVKGKV